MTWKYRPLTATDWSSNGHASEVLWVGTDGSQANGFFVEVGITHGWQYQSIRTAYTAHWPIGGGYQELRFSFPLTLETAYRFTVEPSSVPGHYNAVVYNGTTTYTAQWNNHNGPVTDYSGGLEATCSTSRIDRTYVSLNQFRRSSDAQWIQINNGTLTNSPAPGVIAWCSQPVTFRYYLNPWNSPNDCS